MKTQLYHCRLILLLVISYNWQLSAHAQSSHNYVFDHLTIDDGLSQSTVFAITKDAEGYLWFGTRDGLSRYDSRNIKVYRNNLRDSTSLSGNSIQCFFTDQTTGALWIGTSEGISIYDPTHDNFIQSKLDPDVIERLSNNHVTAIAADRDGVIWVATHGGLNKVISMNPLRYENFSHDEKDDKSLQDDVVRALFRDTYGDLWVGTSIGVSKLQKTRDGKIQFANYRLPSRQLKGKSWINCLAEDDFGNLLIGTEENGVKILDKKTGVIRSLELNNLAGRPIESVRVIERSGNHEFWLGTIDGLYIYNDLRNDIVTLRNNPEDNTTISDNSVRSIFIDSSKTYWIGTFYGGVNSYSPLARQFGEVRLINKTMQKAYKVAGAMVTDEMNNLWISTDGNGLYCLNGKGEMIKQFKHNPDDSNSLSHNKIKCLLLDGNGLWIGTINGLNYLNFKSGTLDHYFHDPSNRNSIPDDRIYDLKKDKDGYIWIATYRGGLCRYDERRKIFERFTNNPDDDHSLSSDGVTFIHEDSNGDLWIGTVSGLNKKPKGNDRFERWGNHVGNNPAGGGDYILCVYEDTNKNLWIGTRDTGLKMKSHGHNTIRQLTTDDGLPGNNISGIQEDSKGYLWISTDNGLSRLDPVKLVFKNYNKSDGLACREFNINSYHKDRNGYLYFGGYNGIIKFHPDSIRENDESPSVVFTRLKIFNKEVPIGSKDGMLAQSLSRTKSLTFNYRQNVFSIEFAGFSFINPTKNQYAYKLEGFEDQWNYVTDPVATYMNLQPGDYKLLAKASNNDGYWSVSPIQMDIQILPPPWKTWWAYTLYTGIILSLLFALIRFNKMRWKLAHDLQLEHVEKEQQEKLHRAKLNFFTNVAHEIRTPLTLIVSPVEVAEERYPDDPFLQRQLQIIKSNTTRLMRLINQLLDFQKQESGNLKLKISPGNIVELLQDIVFSFTEHAHARHIKLRLVPEYDPGELDFDRDEIEKVFCNLLHNAFKFTPSGGEIILTISAEPSAKFLKIVVEDNGIGIPSEDLPKIFDRFFQADHSNISESGFGIGLALAKGIIQMHGGSINAESQEAELGRSGFTRFTILLPVGGNHVTFPEKQSAISEFYDEEGFNEHHEDHDSQTSENEGNERPSILLVEDNIEIRSVLKTILETRYVILEASDGKEGWSITTESLPDIIISDIAMPNMDGIELTRLVKNDLRTDHIPVILLTARGALEHHVEGIETGADDFITKPFHAQILQLKIKNHLETREKLKAKYHRVVTLDPTHEELEDPENKFLMKLKGILEANLDDPDFNVSRLVSEIGMSRPVLFRKIKMITGHSVIDLIRSTRLKKAEMLLKQKKLSISEVAFTVGFNDPKYFSKSFRAQFGKTPTEYIESLEEK